MEKEFWPLPVKGSRVEEQSSKTSDLVKDGQKMDQMMTTKRTATEGRQTGSSEGGMEE